MIAFTGPLDWGLTEANRAGRTAETDLEGQSGCGMVACVVGMSGPPYQGRCHPCCRSSHRSCQIVQSSSRCKPCNRRYRSRPGVCPRDCCWLHDFVVLLSPILDLVNLSPSLPSSRTPPDGSSSSNPAIPLLFSILNHDRPHYPPPPFLPLQPATSILPSPVCTSNSYPTPHHHPHPTWPSA